MGGKSSSQNQATQSQNLDPQIKGALLGNFGDTSNWAKNTAQPNYTGQLTAPFDPTQLQGFGALTGVATGNPGGQTLQQGINTTSGVAGFQPSQVQAGQLAGTNLSPYMNPYTQNVINTTMGELGRQNQITNVGNDAAATSAGAFGGDRSAVLDALTNEGYARQEGQTLAGLNQANYGQAQQGALADIAARQAAATSNQGAGIQGANLRLNAGQGLAAMSGQQNATAIQLAQLLKGVGDQKQAQAQTVLGNNRANFQQNFGNQMSLRELINQALGLAGNPVLGQGQSSGSSTSTNISPAVLGLFGA